MSSPSSICWRKLWCASGEMFSQLIVTCESRSSRLCSCQRPRAWPISWTAFPAAVRPQGDELNTANHPHRRTAAGTGAEEDVVLLERALPERDPGGLPHGDGSGDARLVGQRRVDVVDQRLVGPAAADVAVADAERLETAGQDDVALEDGAAVDDRDLELAQAVLVGELDLDDRGRRPLCFAAAPRGRKLRPDDQRWRGARPRPPARRGRC